MFDSTHLSPLFLSVVSGHFEVLAMGRTGSWGGVRGIREGGIRFREHSGWYGSPCGEHNASCVPA